MKIVFYECEDWEKDHFKAKLDDELTFVDDPINGEVVDGDVLVTFIYSKVDKGVLDKMPSLKLICTRSTGFDHIDLDACKERNIEVCNVPNYGENTVAEHTFAMLLAISRKILPSVERIKGGLFEAHGLSGFDLKGKTLGVIGTGSIGKHVIRIAEGFQMDVIAYDPYPSKELSCKYVSLDILLAKSDIVTIHCPYNKTTHHLINEDNLSKIKKGAILINTARGGIVDSKALFNALHSGQLAGAALDVLEEESEIKEEREIISSNFHQNVDLQKLLLAHVLMNSPKVLITPHTAFNSKEALLRILDTTLDNIATYKKGELINTVS